MEQMGRDVPDVMTEASGRWGVNSTLSQGGFRINVTIMNQKKVPKPAPTK
jgi:hypothetical protein